MKIVTSAVIVLAAFLSFSSHADDNGIVVRYVLAVDTTQTDGTVRTRSYENAILFAYGEIVNIELPGLWSAELSAQRKGSSVQLQLRLNSDVVAEPGAKLGGAFGRPFEMTWQIDSVTVYRATLTPSKGTLPKQSVCMNYTSL